MTQAQRMEEERRKARERMNAVDPNESKRRMHDAIRGGQSDTRPDWARRLDPVKAQE